jgi:parvulin-like peptidyl-prolyl isomerase
MVALLAIAVTGCMARYSNPIPRWLGRETEAESAAETPAAAETGNAAPPAGAATPNAVQPASASTGEAKPPTVDPTRGEITSSIVARVNGDPILAADLFGPIRAQLAEAQQKQSEDEFVKTRAMLIQRQLRALIERQLVIQQAKREIPEPGLRRLQAAADAEFAKQIESLMKQTNVNTEAELRRKMDANGESLDQYRQMSRDTFLAQLFLRQKLGNKLNVSREELFDYYQAHQDQFQREGGVRWREIVIGDQKAGSHQAARRKADEVVTKLRAGGNFAELALVESSGATAEKGGVWPLTPPGSYKVEAVDQALFKLPIGQVSDPIEGPSGWHMVLVDERVDSGQISFADAQNDIRRALRDEKVKKESEAYMKELYRAAHITTIFDPTASKSAGATRK